VIILYLIALSVLYFADKFVIMMLPRILVQNQIRNVLGGETDKITFGRIKYNSRLGAK
jgi:hypothetical protein